MSATAWKAVIDADLSQADYTPRAPIQNGNYPAIVSNVAAKTFKAGSKGVQVTYTLTEGDHKGRSLNSYHVIETKEGQPGTTGSRTLKRLMLACGLSVEAIQKFRYPNFDSNSFGDFKNLLDQPLVLTIEQRVRKSGDQAGKSFAEVVAARSGASA
jgi:hypothetical protein